LKRRIRKERRRKMNNEFAVENALVSYLRKFKKHFNYFTEKLNGLSDEEIVAKIIACIESGKEQKQKEGLIS